MRIARLATAAGLVYARREGDARVRIDDPFAAFAEGREPAAAGAVDDGRVVSPVDPIALIGIAQNGPEHVSPVQAWLKNPRTVIGSAERVALRRDAGTTVAEAEIAVVIGRETSGLDASNAHEYVLGVTAVNDLSSPDRAEFDPRNFESKSGAGYTPLGPWIDTEIDIDDVALSLEVDGEVVADTHSRELPMSIRECLAYVASWTSLGPGDVVMTGAPHSQGVVRPGSTVTAVVADIRLETPLV